MLQRRTPIEEIGRKLKPLFGKKIDDLYFRYSVSDSMDEKNEIVQLLSALYQKHLGKLLDNEVLLNPPEEKLDGEYPLAQVSYAKKQLFPFALREKDWSRHVCVTGMSGSGKTTFAFNILKNFIAKDKPFLVFDWKKSFRPLIGIDNSIMNFTIGNDKISNLFKTNINIPPKGVSPKEWINTLCDLLTESFSASFGVHKILLETLDECFEGWGVYEDGKHYPNWQHVKKMLENKSREAKGRETGWYESALRIATVLTFGDFGKVVNYDGKKSLSVEDLFDKKVIFELNSLSNIEKKFFCEYILTYIYKHKKVNHNKINEGFNHAILVDEAHNVFLKNKTNFVSESVTDMVYREMREYGTSLICLDQHASKLSDTVIGNSACHVAFQQQLPEDIRDISSLMQLQDNKEFFSQLPVGSAIVKLAERYTQPFLVEAPFIDLREHEISDEKISSRMNSVIQGIEVEKHDPEFKQQIMAPTNIIEKQEVIVQEKPKEKVYEFAYELPKSNFEKEDVFKKIADISKGKPEIHEVQKTEVVKEKYSNLTNREKVLEEFTEKKLAEGLKLNEIEKILDAGLIAQEYTSSNIMRVINKFLEEALNKDDYKKETIHIEEKQNNFNSKNFTDEEKRFVAYLLSNPNHENSTVELYKLTGLSTRKGNITKNELLKKGLLIVEEKKYNKGWKKLIRLSQSYSLN